MDRQRLCLIDLPNELVSVILMDVLETSVVSVGIPAGLIRFE